MGRQQKREPPPRVYDQAIVEIEMLDSLNRKYGTAMTRDGRRMYIRSAYRTSEEKAVSSLVEQLASINKKRRSSGVPLWLPCSSDRYTIFYSFDFLDEIKQDIHNPLKATCDLLKKAGLLWDDNRVFQEILEKNSCIPYPRAIITIYKFHKLYYQPAPLHERYDAWLAQDYPDYVPERIAL